MLLLLAPRLLTPVGTVVSPVRTVRTCRRSDVEVLTDESGVVNVLPGSAASLPSWLSLVVMLMDTLALRRLRLGVPVTASVLSEDGIVGLCGFQLGTMRKKDRRISETLSGSELSLSGRSDQQLQVLGKTSTWQNDKGPAWVPRTWHRTKKRSGRAVVW